MVKRIFSSILLSALLAWSLSGCLKEKSFLTDANVQLSFSTDSIRFDTVFTTSGSATNILKVYNPYNENINISRINIKTTEQSFFRLNIDGIAGNDQQNIEIAPFDSLYIFVEVTIDPDNPLDASPFIISDQIQF